ncbi:PEG10: Retrotransposon-derived protein PEG10 [Crotalus adamanteus]|uniref:PEG10: Retrotransposon-derived protein PEG10 n=1 Tax=Crotalus adamanteus TaxID=8729 RepID=A0AAW1BK09_CROAD
MSKLIQQGTPQGLQNLYLVTVTAELKAFFSSPSQLLSKLTPPITTRSLPPPLDLDAEEPKQVGAARQVPGVKEWQRHRQLALCFYCKEPGHMVKNCPTKPPKGVNR